MKNEKLKPEIICDFKCPLPPFMSCFTPVLRHYWSANCPQSFLEYSSLPYPAFHFHFPSSLHLLQDFRGFNFLKKISLCNKFSLRSVLPLSFISFSPSSSSSFSSSWCVGCSQAWRRGGGVRQPQSPEQRWRRQQHQELGAGREHQPEEHHQRELSGAAGGRASFPVFSCLHPSSGAPRGGLLPRRVEGPDAAFWFKYKGRGCSRNILTLLI